MLQTPGTKVDQSLYAWILTGEVRSPVRGKVIGVDRTQKGYTVAVSAFGRYVFTFRGLDTPLVKPFEGVRPGTCIGRGELVEYCVFIRGKGDPLFLTPAPGVAVPLSVLHEEVA